MSVPPMSPDKPGQGLHRTVYYAAPIHHVVVDMSLPLIDPEHYDEQLAAKVQRLQALLQPLGAPAAEVYPSPPLHYRMRAEFSLRRRPCGQLDYVMFEGPGRPVFQPDFPAGSRRINQLMAALRERFNDDPLLGDKLFQVGFLTTLSGEALVTLTYHRRLGEDWTERAHRLEGELEAAVIGRSRKQRVVLSRDHVTEQLTVQGAVWHQRQVEGGFTQPNAAVNQHMLNWASGQAARLSGDLLELYCGNGNFTLPLSRHFRRILATEISKTSIEAAHHNLARNRVDNVALARLASAEVSQALAGVRRFQRLAQAGIELSDYHFTTALVDPPRAGLDDETLALVKRFPQLLYISCNPETMAANLRQLTDWRIERLALFDQFPYTHHIECGVLLQHRSHPGRCAPARGAAVVILPGRPPPRSGHRPGSAPPGQRRVARRNRLPPGPALPPAPRDAGCPPGPPRPSGSAPDHSHARPETG